jgi:hypothetical protein
MQMKWQVLGSILFSACVLCWVAAGAPFWFVRALLAMAILVNVGALFIFACLTGCSRIFELSKGPNIVANILLGTFILDGNIALVRRLQFDWRNVDFQSWHLISLFYAEHAMRFCFYLFPIVILLCFFGYAFNRSRRAISKHSL